jgi:hypothetical protein
MSQLINCNFIIISHCLLNIIATTIIPLIVAVSDKLLVEHSSFLSSTNCYRVEVIIVTTIIIINPPLILHIPIIVYISNMWWTAKWEVTYCLPI